MWRESWQRVTVLVVALVAAACTNAEADNASTTIDLAITTAVETSTTTDAPTTTTTHAPTTTSEFTGTIGSPDSLAELVKEANANSSLAYGAQIPDELLPDLTSADPADAARGLYELEAVVVQTAPVDEWFNVLVFPGSPVSFQYLSDLQTLSTNQLVAVIGGGGYVIQNAQLATPSEVERVPADVRAQLPGGSATVVVTSSSGPINYVDPDGAVVISSEGWTDRSRVVVVAPTESGWKLYWAEDV